MSNYYIVLTFFLSILATSCRTIKPTAPLIDVQETVIPEQKSSIIKIPIKINLAPYFNESNKSVPVKFTGSESQCSGVSYSYKFLRDPIKFEGKGNHISYEVNGKYSLYINYCPECTGLITKEPFCIIPRSYFSCGVGEPMRKMFVSYNTKVEISENYQLESKTKLAKLKALTPCQISLINYDATSMLEKEVKKALQDVEKDIDKEISSINLKPDIQYTWEALCEPIDMNGYGFMYLHPSKVYIDQLKFKGDTAYLNAYLQTAPEVFTEKHDTTEIPLPKLSHLDAKEVFDVVMDIEASYDSLSTILSENIRGTKTQIKGKEVIFGDVEIHGAANEQLNIKVEFSGKKKGTLFLTGTPKFDWQKQHLSFPDLEFEVKTRSALIKSAKWLFDDKITSMIREAASVDLTPYLNQLKTSLNENLNGEITKGVSMTGEILDFTINLIHPQESELFLRIESKGKINIQM